MEWHCRRILLAPDQFNSFTGPTVREPDDPGGRGGTYYDQNIKILTYDNITHL
jgi:hypothetical protein